MRLFSELYAELDQTTSTNDKVDALVRYFKQTPAEDAAWALYFLSGRRLKRIMASAALRSSAVEASGLPVWLFEDSYAQVGDLAETIGLLVPNRASAQPTKAMALHQWMHEKILPLRNMEEVERSQKIKQYWTELLPTEMLVFNKIITGAFRVGVSHTLVVRALAQAMGLNTAQLTHKLMGEWEPSPAFFQNLSDLSGDNQVASQPYPFFLASPLEGGPETLGPITDWQAEWKWDGIRAQLIRRQGEVHLWSRGEEIITTHFPEPVLQAATKLEDGMVLDGELLAFKDGRPLPFSELQRRMGRKKPSKAMLGQVPVVLMAYDLLEYQGVDFRDQPLRIRRHKLERVIAQCGAPLLISTQVTSDSWADLARLRASSRELGVEGLMLKALDSAYLVGRKRGSWWKWKIDPLTMDAVLIYAQAGHGRRANLYTDYTFAVWHQGELKPVAKAYSGLNDDEIKTLDAWIRQHTLQKFGPVRSVEPLQVFELGFEAIGRSTRHKSGIAVRFPRILRWRTDKKPNQADTLEHLSSLIH